MAVLSYFRRGISTTSSLLVICLFTLLNLGWIEASSNSNVTCHPQCVCFTNSTVDCSNKALNSLPKNLPSNSSVLLLNQNNIETLSPQLLSHLPSLNKINLSDNPINCNCSLSWILNASVNVQIVGKCSNPVAVKGKTITSLTTHEMCDLTLTITESPVVKFEKETVNLNCQPSLLASVYWSRKSDGSADVTSVKTLGSRFRVLDNGTLVIETLTSTDQGEYTCIVEHKYGARANKSIFLEVKEPFVTVNPSNIKLVEGENGTSDCVASGDSKIIWKYDGGDLDSNHFKVLDGTLFISNAQTKNSGKYVCAIESNTKIKAIVTIHVQAICKIDDVMLGSNMPTINSTKRRYIANDVIKLSCADGYDLNGSSVLKCQSNGTWSSEIFPKCEDDDECKTNICDGNATCRNTLGSYKCICNTGYERNGKSCVDDDECKTNICDGNATCRNTMGSYICNCNAGYQSNGKSCKEISVPPTTVMPTVKNVTRMTNLTKLIQETNGIQSTESLKRTLGMLEELVYRVKNGDSKKTKHFLHVASNLMGKQNHATWAKVQQTFPGVERLLRAVNEAMKLQAMEMLKNHGNRTERFSSKFYNLDVEILVDVGEMMAKKRIVLPRSTKDDYIEFPTSIFQKFAKQPVAVIVFSFKQLDKLLPKRSLITDFDSFGTDSHVLSGIIISLNGTLSTPVTITFKNKEVGGAKTERTECVFWKYDETVKIVDEKSYLKNVYVSKGGWSGEGCNVSRRNKSSTICQCDHLTDFAVLTSKTKMLEIVDPSVVIYVGSILLLIAALIAFIRNIVVWCQTRRERLLVLINECLAIVLVATVFLVGVFVDYQETLCVALGALMHWLVLSVFFWILVEEIQLYLAVHFGCDRSSSRLKYFIFVGWVFPAIIVCIILAITQLDEYGSTQWCWYNNSLTLFLSYVCPIVLCVLICVIVILKIASLKALMADNADKKDVSIILALSGFLIPLVAVTCITAALCADQPEKDVFQYLFVVFCIVLGIYILYYHCWLDREITKISVRSNKRTRPKRDYYSTKETVLYSPGTSEGKSFSLVFPSRKSPSHGKKSSKSDTKRSNKRSDSASPFDYDSNVPMYPPINDSSLKSFRSQVSTQQHTLENPPHTLSAITISRPNSQCIELTSLSDLERRPDGAEQTDSGDHSEFYGPRNSNPLDKVRQRTSGSSDVLTATNATTFGKDNGKPVQRSSDTPSYSEEKNRISTTSSAGISRSSVSGASFNAVEESEMTLNEDGFEKEPFLRSETNPGPEVKSDPPAKIPKRRKKGSRRRLDDEVQEEETEEPKLKAKQKSSSLPSNDGSVKLKQYTGF